MALGTYKHSASKTAKAYRGGAAHVRSMAVDVRVARSGTQYGARACVRHGGVAGHSKARKCGPFELARSPTAATKKALHALARKLK